MAMWRGAVATVMFKGGGEVFPGEYLRKYKGLIAVLMTMAVVSAGAFAITYYTWTVPIRVEILTYTFTISSKPIISGATQAQDNWGTNASASENAVPASNSGAMARIYLDNLDENVTHTRTFRIYFEVENDDVGNATAFENLTIQINLYLKDDNLTDWTGENVTLSQVISDGLSIDRLQYADNSGAGFQPGVTLDCVIWAFENTDNVSAAADVTIPIRVYIQENSIENLATK